jgi:hypothetical protein
VAKILNLDKLVEEKRYLKLFGKEYLIEEMTVDNFLVTNDEADKLKDENSIPKQVDATVKMLNRSIPSCPEDVLRKLPLSQLQVVVAFVRGDDEHEVVESKDDNAGK